MARTGRFGRQPRSAASLTSTLVAIAREFQNQRAQNIMDAWQKGGTFEGKKATDDVVLKFWKDKMAGVSKDDPLYDTYKNAHTQLDYTIHESKMTAGYAMKKYSDSQMVAFYLGWAKKVPKDSEFYRVLQRDAGQYMRTNRANTAAEEARRKEERYQKQQAGTQKQMEAAGEYTIEVLRRIAQSGNVGQGITATIAAPGSGSDLTDFDPTDPGIMMRLIAAITPQGSKTVEVAPGVEGAPTYQVPDGKHVGNPEVLFYDDDKKPVTGADIMAKLAKLDPGYVPGTPLDVNYVTDLLDRQMQGLNERIKRAKDTGHMTDVASLTKSKSYVALLNREVAAYPVQKAYEEARSTYDAVVADKSSSPQAVLKAWDEYAATLTKLSNDPRIVADDNMRSRLIAERDGTPGVPTLHESFTGLANSQFDPGSSTDAAENAAGIEFMRAQVEAVANGQAVWTYGEKDSNGVFVPKAGGRQIGAATTDAVQAGGENMQPITIPDALGGAPLTMYVTATPIYATAKDPVTGEPLPSANSNPIGYAYDIPKGSGFETQYGFQTKDGFVFSSDPPFDESKRLTASSKGGNHLEVDFSDEVAKSLGYADKDPVTGEYTTKPDLSADADLPNGVSVRASNEWDAATGEQKPAQVIFKPQDLAWSTDTRNGLGSTDPMTDFKSLTLSNLMTSTDGRAILSNLDKNPAYKDTMDADAYRSSGYTRDLKTGAWVAGEGADPNKLNAALGQQNLVTQAKTVTDFLSNAAKTWQKVTTGSPFMGGDKGNVTGQTGPGFTVEGFAKLATDLVQGTPFEALGKVFVPGTSSVAPPKSDVNGATGFVIKPVATMKLPGFTVTPGGEKKVVGSVASPTTQVQTGSQAPGGTSSQTGSTATQSSSLPPNTNKYL